MQGGVRPGTGCRPARRRGTAARCVPHTLARPGPQLTRLYVRGGCDSLSAEGEGLGPPATRGQSKAMEVSRGRQWRSQGTLPFVQHNGQGSRTPTCSRAALGGKAVCGGLGARAAREFGRDLARKLRGGGPPRGLASVQAAALPGAAHGRRPRPRPRVLILAGGRAAAVAAGGLLLLVLKAAGQPRQGLRGLKVGGDRPAARGAGLRALERAGQERGVGRGLRELGGWKQGAGRRLVPSSVGGAEGGALGGEHVGGDALGACKGREAWDQTNASHKDLARPCPARMRHSRPHTMARAGLHRNAWCGSRDRRGGERAQGLRFRESFEARVVGRHQGLRNARHLPGK